MTHCLRHASPTLCIKVCVKQRHCLQDEDMKVTLYLIQYYTIHMCGEMRCEGIASPILRGSDCPVFPENIPGLLILKRSVPVSQKIWVVKRPGIFFQ